VVKLREVYLSASHLNVVMEYASGGSLFECVREERTLSESVARWFFQQLVLALDYCHRRVCGAGGFTRLRRGREGDML
jgi:serine/threonine-protein kinase SRK2